MGLAGDGQFAGQGIRHWPGRWSAYRVKNEMVRSISCWTHERPTDARFVPPALGGPLAYRPALSGLWVRSRRMPVLSFA